MSEFKDVEKNTYRQICDRLQTALENAYTELGLSSELLLTDWVCILGHQGFDAISSVSVFSRPGQPDYTTLGLMEYGKNVTSDILFGMDDDEDE